MSILGGSSIGILDISDGIISGTEPRNPVEGMLWIDTSNGNKTLKVYQNGRWETQTLDVGQLDPDLMTKINGIMDNLGTIGDDGVLTFSDRVILVKELGQIIGAVPSKASGNVYPSSLPAYNVLDSSGSGSFANIRTRALSVGIETNSSWYKDLESAYTSLNSYLSQYNPKPWDVTSANKDKTTTLTDPDMFRQKFLTYYLAELSLTTETEIAAKKAAEDYTDRLTDGSSVIDKATSYGNPVFTDKADDDSVVHVEIEGKSVGGGSGKNLLGKAYQTVSGQAAYLNFGGTSYSEIENGYRIAGRWSAFGWKIKLEPNTNYIMHGNLSITNTSSANEQLSIGINKHSGSDVTGSSTTISSNGRFSYVFTSRHDDYEDIIAISSNADVSNSAQFDVTDLMLEKRTVDTPSSYEPPAPTPEYPIAINSLNNVDVVSSKGGRNLLLDSSTNLFTNGRYGSELLSSYLGVNNVIKVSLPQNTMYFSPAEEYSDILRAGKEYTLSFLFTYEGVKGDNNLVYLSSNTGSYQKFIGEIEEGKFNRVHVPINPTSDHGARLHMHLGGYETVYLTGFKLEENTTATPYSHAPEDIQPDTPNPTIYKTNISLPEPLRSVGDVKDRLFRDTDGFWKVERRVRERVFDGTESWYDYGSHGTKTMQFARNDLNDRKVASTADHIQSTHFKTAPWNTQSRAQFDEQELSGNGTSSVYNYMYLRINREHLTSENTSGMQLWVKGQYDKGTPLKVVYELETPTIEILPDDLQQKLNNIQSYKGSNYVYTANTNLDKIGISPTLNATFKSKGWYDKWKTNDNVKDIVDNKIPEVQEEIKEATRLPVRFIRDTLAGSSENTNSHWVEIQAMKGNENVALNKPVEASSTVSSGNTNLVTDGNTLSASYVSINNSTTSEEDSEGNTVTTVTPEYVVVDLGKVYKDLDYIKVWHYYQDNRTYNGSMLEVSPDGEEWTTVFDSSLSGTYEETSSGRAYSLVANDLANNLLSQTTNLTSRVTDVERLTNAESIVDTVMSQSKFTSWQETVDAKPNQKDLQNVTDTLDATSEKVEIISTDLSKVEQTAKDWGVALTQQQEILNEQGETVNQVVTYMKFKATGLEIGKSDSEMKVNISNTQIDFMDNGVSVAWINGQQLYIRNAQVLNSLVIGNHKFEKLPNGMTAINWFGD